MVSSTKRLVSILLVLALMLTYIPVFNANSAFAAAKKPGKVKSIKVNVTARKAKISWSKAKRAKKYEIKVTIGKKIIKKVKTKKKSLALKNLKTGKTYTVMIRGIAGKKKGAWKKKFFKIKTPVKKTDDSSNKDTDVDVTPNPEPTPDVTPEPEPEPEQGQEAESEPEPEQDPEWENHDAFDNGVTTGSIEELMVNGDIDASYNDLGGVGYIDGTFTDMKVEDADSARELLGQMTNLIGTGFDAYNTQIESSTESLGEGDEQTESVIYKVKPEYEGYKVLGSEVILETDTSGNVTTLFNTYDSRLSNTSLYWDIDENEAAAIAAKDFVQKNSLTDKYVFDGDEDDETVVENMKNEFDINTELIIYAADSDFEPFMAYQIRISSTSFNTDYFVIASSDCSAGEAGEIFFVEDGFKDAWTYSSVQAVDAKGVTRSVNLQKDGQNMRLIDSDRNIEVYEAIHSDTQDDTSLLPGNLVQGTSLPAKAVSVYTGLAKSYDFYKSIGRKSYDNKGHVIKASYNFRNNSDFDNASWGGWISQIVYGNVHNYENGIDVTGHELTHAVVGSTAKLGGCASAEALNEAYADVMGSLIEGKTNEHRWIIGEDTSYEYYSKGVPCIRDMSEPILYSEYSNANDCHYNARIMDYAMYLFMTDSRTSGISNKTWGKVFLGSLQRMSSTSSFMAARDTIVAAARDQKFTDAQIKAIKEAFTKIGITADRVRVVMRWFKEPSDLDLHIVGNLADGNHFHTYFEDMTYFINSKNLVANLNYDDTDYYGPEISTIYQNRKGTYNVFVHDYTNREESKSDVLYQSGVEIKIYKGDDLSPVNTFRLDSHTKNALLGGLYWDVCKITIDGNKKITVTPVNNLTYSQPYE